MYVTDGNRDESVSETLERALSEIDAKKAKTLFTKNNFILAKHSKYYFANYLEQ